MPAPKVFETEVWCPSCRTVYGKVSRREIRDGVYEHVTEPKKVPAYCSVCEGVLRRKS